MLILVYVGGLDIWTNVVHSRMIPEQLNKVKIYFLKFCSSFLL